MGFWKTFFGGATNPEDEKKNAEERNFDLLKYDGVKAMRIGQLDYAAKCFLKALETKEDPEVRDYLSRAFMRLGRFDESLQQLQALIAAEPDNVNLLMQAASVAYMKEDYEQMTALCEKGLATDVGNALVHIFYAKAELGQRHLVEAVARLTKAITLDERLVEPRLLRAQTLLGMGDLAGAAADGEWLMEHTEANEDVLLLQARIAAAQGHADEALATYGRVIDVNPFCIDAFRERGVLLLQQGDKAGAEADMKMVLELNPQEMADVTGEYAAEGIEQKTRQAYSNLNPFGI